MLQSENISPQLEKSEVQPNLRKKPMRFDGTESLEADPEEVRKFWARVEQVGECLVWNGPKTNDGHGRFIFKGKGAPTHRFAWFLKFGYIPRGKLICHNCPGGDNPSCVNTDHLFIGTDMDNWRDCQKKGRNRHPAREDHGRAILTEQDVISIRKEYVKFVVSRARLARKYSVSESAIAHILSGKNWKTV